MAWRIAAVAEIAFGGDECRVEMMLPDPVHHHAGGKWVLLVHDGAGQIEPSAASLEDGRIFSGYEREKMTVHFVAGRIGVSAFENSGISLLGAVFQDQRIPRGAGCRDFPFLDCRL